MWMPRTWSLSGRDLCEVLRPSLKLSISRHASGFSSAAEGIHPAGEWNPCIQMHQARHQMRCRTCRFRCLVADMSTYSPSFFWCFWMFLCFMFDQSWVWKVGCCMAWMPLRMLPRTMGPPLVPAEKVTLISFAWTVPQSISPPEINVNNAMIRRCSPKMHLSLWQQSRWFLRWSVVALGFGCGTMRTQKYSTAQVLPALWRSSWKHNCQSFCNSVTRWW